MILASKIGRHLNALFTRKQLDEWGVRYDCLTQGPGQLVVTLADTYHQGFSRERTFAAAVNVAPENWNPRGDIPCERSCGLFNGYRLDEIQAYTPLRIATQFSSKTYGIPVNRFEKVDIHSLDVLKSCIAKHPYFRGSQKAANQALGFPRAVQITESMLSIASDAMIDATSAREPEPLTPADLTCLYCIIKEFRIDMGPEAGWKYQRCRLIFYRRAQQLGLDGHDGGGCQADVGPIEKDTTNHWQEIRRVAKVIAEELSLGIQDDPVEVSVHQLLDEGRILSALEKRFGLGILRMIPRDLLAVGTHDKGENTETM